MHQRFEEAAAAAAEAASRAAPRVLAEQATQPAATQTDFTKETRTVGTQWRSMAATTGDAPAATLRGLSASADEPEEPRYTACSAGASSYSVGGSEMEQQVLEEEDMRALEKLEAIANGFEAAGDHYHAAVARELRARFLEPEM